MLAIASEVAATISLKLSQGFTRLGPSLVVIIGYGAAFYFLSLSIKHIPLGVAYAIWSGLGAAGAVLAGVLLWHETLDPYRAVGIALILIGTVMLNLSR
ncbi:multidrug efflux SMR transporter [Hydrogenibacillus sp. N12]|uniref:DMT family transporter n=1 Tax=Hydrogenibacillus sp. N12 TaxID=2866627 RepID=UPI0025A5C6CD|nr:multidrug efflux SMR transporter [Hydrogenibacillus sp. N12]